MARRRVKQEQVKNDQWLIPFSSTTLVLLILFILLYSFSTMDEQSLSSIPTSLQGILTGQGAKVKAQSTVTVENTASDLEKKANINEIYEKSKKFIEDNKLGASVELKQDDRGVILQLRDSVLFESGKADLIPNSKNLLDKLGSLIKTVPNNIIVEGHTDNVPINTYRFQSNWDLSASRAVNVVKFFIDQENVNAARFTAAGFGEYKPIVDNSTAENRAKNRRINILIVAIEREKK
ncbi:OmpA family protein [Clostridium folliculivorans]|uniref:Chemotaxis protein MotB n=1 Tax=Clostridium folliculivorans TaxID=2886038 RepID=A0A9W6D967_9CLOT|nr:OmpA family protein [Clostridium folliculivorans]GKU23581.1 chemotaxis protein MotB [Clostridium folliculivorans]GKU29697.1 chemotaxis protein MotB [Clostridium folliculivorans]